MGALHLTFRRVKIADAEMLLEWRTRPEITRYMYSDLDHDIEAQRLWIADCEGAVDYRHFVIEYDGAPSGYLSFSRIDPEKRQCTTGFYIAERGLGQRFAGVLDLCMVDYAFAVLDVDRIENGVLEGNERSVVFHEKAGFQRIAGQARHVVKKGATIDVHVYALERANWQNKSRPFPLEDSLAAFEAVKALENRSKTSG